MHLLPVLSQYAHKFLSLKRKMTLFQVSHRITKELKEARIPGGCGNHWFVKNLPCEELWCRTSKQIDHKKFLGRRLRRAQVPFLKFSVINDHAFYVFPCEGEKNFPSHQNKLPMVLNISAQVVFYQRALGMVWNPLGLPRFHSRNPGRHAFKVCLKSGCNTWGMSAKFALCQQWEFLFCSQGV